MALISILSGASFLIVLWVRTIWTQFVENSTDNQNLTKTKGFANRERNLITLKSFEAYVEGVSQLGGQLGVLEEATKRELELICSNWLSLPDFTKQSIINMINRACSND